MGYIKRFFTFLWRKKIKILEWAGMAVFLGMVFAAFLFIYYSKDLPSPEALNDLFVPESTKIYDRTETSLLYDIYGEQKRTIIAGGEMPDSIRDATVVIEDDQFYHHMGLDFRGILRALVVNLRGGEVRQGGSTITQQFIKNSFLTPERTLARKIKEAILSFELELRYSKDEILTFYLNQVPYGSNAYGIEAAAQTFLNKSAKDLTLAESATIAALPQAPTYYTNNPAALQARKNHILNKMLEFGYINEKEHQEALDEPVEIEKQLTEINAPHFVIEVKQYLENKYGPTFVQQAGLKVVTTLDPSIQEAAEEAILERASFNVSNFRAHNAALVAIDPYTGQILAMVGSKNYFGDTEPENCVSGQTCLFDPQVNVSTTPQQPGSSFKPVAYAKAFEKGYTPNTIVYDVPTEFNTNCPATAKQEKDEYGLDCYHPQNYDLQFYGPTPLKEALAQSRNIPSVKVLYLAGVQDTIKLAQDMGIDSLQDTSRYGLSLVLGGGDVTLVEEVGAYGVFAARGEKTPTTMLLRVEDKEGNVLEEYRKNTKRVLDKNIADQINHVLSTNEYRVRTFGEQNNLIISGLPVAAKTGTTQDYRDAWTVGYSPSIVAGVWVGNNNNKPMVQAPGSQAAAPIWNNFMRKVYSKKSTEESNLREKEFYFSLPLTNEERPFVQPVIKDTGKDILDGKIKTSHSILHYISLNNPRGPEPTNPQNNPQYENWENAVKNWALLNDLPVEIEDRDINIDPKEQNINQTETSGPFTISFLSPQKRLFDQSESMLLDVQVNSLNPLSRAKIYLNREQILQNVYGGNNIRSVKLTKNIDLNVLEKNTLHEILVEVEDQDGGKGSASFIFKTE